MRSTIFLLSSLAALVGASLFAASGCADDQNLVALDAAPKGTGDTPMQEGDGTSQATQDAAIVAPRLGSPLCGVGDSCVPDQLKPSCEADAPLDASADAGRIKSCRVEANKPGCFTGNDRDGVDGVACAAGTDCSPGFDCVAGARGGVCRRYCCSGSCEDQTSQNGGPTFCDVQKLFPSQRTVPVCMPVKKCKLFAADGCGAAETCAVVDESGATACVARGPAGVGASCVDQHCQESLTCLGSPSNRLCYALCRVDGSTCPNGEKCTTSTLFEAGFGICKEM